MIEKAFQTLLLPACVLAWFALVGCTTEYVFEFKDSRSDVPIRNATVEASSCHRIYSFLDLRHYLAADSGKAVTEKGRTDEEGKVALSLPSDLGLKYVSLENEWFVREPAPDWQPMLTRGEYEARATEANLQAQPDRPLIKIEKR